MLGINSGLTLLRAAGADLSAYIGMDERLRGAKAARLACGLLAVPPGGVRVRLRAGRYHAAAGGAALRLTPADSGLDGAPITYEPYGDGEVSISAGLAIPASAFTAWRGGIVKADLAALDLRPHGSIVEVLRAAERGDGAQPRASW